MPDRRTHRGPHPEDERLFAADGLPILRQAVADLCWLLSRGYAPESSLKLVGDCYDLGRPEMGGCCSMCVQRRSGPAKKEARSRSLRAIGPAALAGRISDKKFDFSAIRLILP
jgi:hypothetical protein